MTSLERALPAVAAWPDVTAEIVTAPQDAIAATAPQGRVQDAEFDAWLHVALVDVPPDTSPPTPAPHTVQTRPTSIDVVAPEATSETCVQPDEEHEHDELPAGVDCAAYLATMQAPQVPALIAGAGADVSTLPSRARTAPTRDTGTTPARETSTTPTASTTPIAPTAPTTPTTSTTRTASTTSTTSTTRTAPTVPRRESPVPAPPAGRTSPAIATAPFERGAEPDPSPRASRGEASATQIPARGKTFAQGPQRRDLEGPRVAERESVEVSTANPPSEAVNPSPLPHPQTDTMPLPRAPAGPTNARPAHAVARPVMGGDTEVSVGNSGSLVRLAHTSVARAVVDDPTLGHVAIEASNARDGVQIAVSVERADVHETLEVQRGTLTRDLEAARVRVDVVHVDWRPERRRADGPPDRLEERAVSYETAGEPRAGRFISPPAHTDFNGSATAVLRDDGAPSGQGSATSTDQGSRSPSRDPRSGGRHEGAADTLHSPDRRPAGRRVRRVL